MIPCGNRDVYVVGVMPFFFSIFLIRKSMMNAKDTEEKERGRNHYSSPTFSMTNITIMKKEIRIPLEYMHGLRLKDSADTLVVEELSL